ncbi:MAG TPA: D-alanyl-D-alanine carboxypeptidase/D-alanyl-D-alanine-endopeptidase [Gammaproteobacteria bacterium]|nr:D-alanyl-D-alanine carboxypeptidase/D-alanyl-D-alanine-endopeptidase [Gammaproteobacteria bacterium]
MKSLRALFALSLLLNTAICWATVKAAPALNQKITHMIKANLPDATVGVTVQDAQTGEIIYDYHGSHHFLPASTTKLFTAAAALKSLGPDYRFETGLYYNPQAIHQTAYQGDVALKFSGDPSFQLASLYSLLQRLSDAHVKKITGNFIIDDSIFTGPLWALGWTWDSTPWHHAAPVAAIIIDRNQFGVTLIPTPKVGGKVGAKLDQGYPGSKFRTMVADVRAVTYEDSETMCQITAVVDEKNNLELGGCWPIGTEPVHLRLAIKNPRLQAVQLINEALQKLDIQLSGKITFAAVPTNMVKLAHHSSEPLSVLLKPILAESNNLYAESLTKTLGAHLYGVGSFKTGSAAVQKVLTDVTGIDFSDARLLDGSGESRYNLLTPRHLARLLFVMRGEKNVAGHFRNALAISGMNGSLQNRFTKMHQVQAKTGSLSGVSTLAGYFTTSKKRELIVAIMINQAIESNVLLKHFEDELCYYLMEQL